MFAPSLFPKTVEELYVELDEEAIVAAQEEELRKKFLAVREHQKGAQLLGVTKSAEAEGQQQEDEEQAEEEEEDVDAEGDDDDDDDELA